MQLIISPNPIDHHKMLETAVREWVASPEGKVDGIRVSAREAIDLFRQGLALSGLEMLLLVMPPLNHIAGFAVVSATEGWLEGHLFYLKPEFRGAGLLREHFDQAVDLANDLGLKGFRMRSTSKRWSSLPGFESSLYLAQSDGTEVYDYRRTAMGDLSMTENAAIATAAREGAQ